MKTRLVLLSVLTTLLLVFLFRHFLISPSDKLKSVAPVSRPITESQIPESLIRLASASPEMDFRIAAASGDVTFLGVAGYAVEVPGVSNYQGDFKSRIGLKIIDGTSDEIMNQEHARLQGIARDYALRYNKLVLDSIKSGTLPVRK